MKHAPIILHSDTIQARWQGDGKPPLSGDGFYIAAWPEHVLIPRYNGDAGFYGPYTSVGDALQAEPKALLYAGLEAQP